MEIHDRSLVCPRFMEAEARNDATAARVKRAIGALPRKGHIYTYRVWFRQQAGVSSLSSSVFSNVGSPSGASQARTSRGRGMIAHRRRPTIVTGPHHESRNDQ